MARHVFIFPIASETRHARDDDSPVDPLQFRGTQAHFLQYPGTEGVDDDVYPRDQGFDQSDSRRGFGVDGYGVFVPG